MNPLTYSITIERHDDGRYYLHDVLGVTSRGYDTYVEADDARDAAAD